MNDETTRLLNETTGNTQKAAPAQQNTSAASAKGKKAQGKSFDAAMYAAGGAVAGAAVGAAVTATAAKNEDPILDVEKPEESPEATVETPAEEQVILANDEGVRYAHVEADNFNDAFAQARSQVGAGGVFEYEGRLYGTYTAAEWNDMSAQERADYQARVNEVAPSHSSLPTQNNDTPHYAGVAESHAAPMHVQEVAHNTEMISAEPVDNEIHVLGVQTVQTTDGEIMNIAVVECQGDHALLVDVDNSGTMDCLVHDDNRDGYIQPEELHDISEAGIHVNDLLETQATQAGGYYYAANDDMPDYINDADSIMSV